MTTVVARVAVVVGVASWHHGHHGLHLGKESSFTSGKGSFTLEHSSILGNFGNWFLDHVICRKETRRGKPTGRNISCVATHTNGSHHTAHCPLSSS
jgi:hypothetical protein